MTFNVCNDKVIQQLLVKLEEGSETVTNLRSLLTRKTVELNEMIQQLELIDQVINRVEIGTERIENIIKGILDCKSTKQDSLLDAEATLDSAIKSACNLYSKNSTRNSMLNKIKKILIELNIPSAIYKYKKDDTIVLQKAYHDLNLAKNMVTPIQSNYKYRTTLMNNKRVQIEKINKIGLDIRNKVALFKSYTRNSSFMINNKDILSILDREDKELEQVYNRHHTTNKQQQKLTSLQSITRPTSSSMAKSKDKKSHPSTRPGSTLRLRNILAKRTPPSLLNSVVY